MPKVKGYLQIEYKGEVWHGINSIYPVSKSLMLNIAEADFDRTGIKSKFRIVYE